MDVEVICFATNRTPGLHNWEASCRRFGYTTRILGLGERWKGYLTKIKGYLDYLQSSPSDRLYIITDAYDVMACRHGDITKTYQTFQTPLVVSTENVCVHNCRPVTSWWRRHPDRAFRAGNYKYVNSGFMMGTREAIIAALEYIMASGWTDDQYALCEYLNQYPERGALDTESKLMGTLTMVGTDFTRPPGTLTRKSTQAQPYFLHSPGIRWDLGRRYNSWGRYLLGSEFQPYAAKEDILSNSNWRLGLAVSVWVLLALFYLCPPLGGLFLGILIIYVMVCCWS